LVADDKLLQRDVIAMYAGKIAQLEIVAVCGDGLEAFNVLTKESIDIVFSDINMPHLNGLELRKSLKNPPIFIFISDYPEYAVESYELDVVDYIVKPVTFERLLKAVNKAIEYITAKQRNPVIEEDAFTATANNYFFIKEGADIIRLKYEDVVYAESMGNFSKLYMTNGKRHIALVILKHLETQLPQDVFIRVHKQYVINHSHISKIGTNELVLMGTITLPISQTYRQTLLDRVVQQNMVSRTPPGNS
jgi:DNA-binding LytR/AlgR family response regulator